VRPLVLCYHAVSPTWEHRLSITPALLLRQVRALLRFRSVRVTFDDAFRSAATVIPALRQLGVPVQIFVCSSFAREGRPLTIAELEGDDPGKLATMGWDDLRGMVGQSVEIGSHSVSHAHLTSLSDSELETELVDSKREIEAELGRPCTELAYPYGEHDERVRAAARAAGYAWAFALWDGPKDDPYAAPRLDLYRRHTPARAVLMSTPLHRLVA
jgi:peptidoglycan/xylan/chitin deacetylase (PgdA/CDA1 family)